MIKKNRKGFTLTELLAVIIILGVLLLIAVPSISNYTWQSRIKTYATNLQKIVDEVSIQVHANSDGYIFSEDEYLIVPIACIQLEKGSTEESPFGSYIKENSFIIVTIKDNKSGFEFYVSAKDERGFGTKLSLANNLKIEEVSDDDLGKISETGIILPGYGYLTLGKEAEVVTCDAFNVEVTSNINIGVLSSKILEDNNELSDSDIDLTEMSSDTNGKGLYYTNVNTEGNGTTYYFRGDVTNNYVSFAGHKWRIIRINEDGSIRMIKTSSIGYSYYNRSVNDPAKVGYMYGTPESTSYDETFANKNDSIVKGVIDKWYESNLKANYASYLADAGFCNDRSLHGSGTDSSSWGYFGKYSGYYNIQPQFACPQNNDLFTTSSSPKGNKALKYPIGLITADEVTYAGNVFINYGFYNSNKTGNNTYYLYRTFSGSAWTMTPTTYFGVETGIAYITPSYFTDYYGDSTQRGVYPVINLKSTVEITGGNGTKDTPYVVRTN